MADDNDIGIGGLIGLAVVGGVCFMLFKGGQALYRENVAPSASADCFHLAKVGWQNLCVTEKPASRPCLSPDQWVAMDAIACFDDNGKAAEFVKNSGRKVCSTFVVKESCSDRESPESSKR